MWAEDINNGNRRRKINSERPRGRRVCTKYDECSRRHSERQIVTSLLSSRVQVQQARLAEPEKPKSRTEVRERKAKEDGLPSLRAGEPRGPQTPRRCEKWKTRQVEKYTQEHSSARVTEAGQQQLRRSWAEPGEAWEEKGAAFQGGRKKPGKTVTSHAPFLVAGQAGQAGQASTLSLLAPSLVSTFHLTTTAGLPIYQATTSTSTLDKYIFCKKTHWLP